MGEWDRMVGAVMQNIEALHSYKVDVDVYIHELTYHTTNNRDRKLSKVSETFLDQIEVAKILPTRWINDTGRAYK